MQKVNFYQVYKNGEKIKGLVFSCKRTAIGIMQIEAECDAMELNQTRPDSQFVVTMDEDNATVDEYYYDENYEEDCWNFDVSTFEVKEEEKEVEDYWI